MITFQEQTTFDSESDNLIFFAVYEDKIIPCHVSTEAIDDVDPSNESNTKRKFEDNRIVFEEIAKKKILDGALKLFISTMDLP